jgi:hypothetical protein
MGTSYFFVEETVFQILSYGFTPEGGNPRGSHAGGLSLNLYIRLATATDQSLVQWSVNYSVKSGRIEIRSGEFNRSSDTLIFEDAVCSSYSEENNPGNAALPRLINMCITPVKMYWQTAE